MTYRLLDEGEIYKKGDEYFNGMGVWHLVPDTWFKFKHSHEGDNTMSRMKLPVRREFSLLGVLEEYLVQFKKESPDSDYDNDCGAFVFIDFIKKH